MKSYLLPVMLLVAGMTVVPARAQSRPRSTDASVAEKPAVSKNPTFLFRTLSFSQEWDHLSNGHGFTSSLGYTEPLRNASMSLGISVPFATASPMTPAHGSLVLSDLALKSQWIPHVTSSHGVLLTGTLTLPTSQDDAVGTGKWSVTPSAAYARFWGPRFLLAQFVQQQVSLAGQESRARINRTDLDLYGVYSARSLQWWINGDVNLRIDEANRKQPSSATLSYGRGLKKIFGGTLNGSLQTGVGLGRDRPYDFMLTGGISLVGMHR
ncbi:hypothetical protein [Terriglobus tenax]|uniref:hypothetical protein n=1 Tax=Terriglobus tenax TaxID=1111115 RepID=UPI0021DFF181|nr:hypothetical protein [Terriglobus tenax]